MKERLIKNNFGLKIIAEYVANNFMPEYYIASSEMIDNVIKTARFESIEKNGMQLVKLFVLEDKLGAAWFKGGIYTTLTHVMDIKGLTGNLQENTNRMELIINK